MDNQEDWFPPNYPEQRPRNTDEGGYYNPQAPKYPYLDNYQDWVNNTRGKISRQTQRAVHNLIKQMSILRAENLKLAGESIMWLRRKTSGTRCPNFNGNYDHCETSKCILCFGTTFLGGYEKAIRIPVSFQPGRVDTTVEEAGITISQKPSAWTIITEPIIQQRDIFISFANERYEVVSPEAVEHQGIRHHQEMQLNRIDKFDVKYSVPSPFILADAETSFKASIVIRKPYQDFKASIVIMNYLFSEDGEFHAEL